MEQKNPIFIIGTERSGSNLLRLILNAHSQIAIPHPPHIIHFFEKLERSYGDLNQPLMFKRLIHDVVSLLKTHIHPWEIEISPERIFQESSPRDLFGIYYNIYDQYLQQAGKKRWGCKSTFMIGHVERVFQHYPAARFIWLVRDPRDVAASSLRSVFNPFHPYFTANLWRKQQLEGFRLAGILPPKNFMLLKYEDLIATPETVIRSICGFLEEPYEPEMLNYYQGSAAQKSSKLSESWKNNSRPIISENKNKYKESLSSEEIQIVEGITADLMNKFGYSLEFPDTHIPQPSWAQMFLYRLQDRILYIKTEWHSLWSDKNYWLRFKRTILMKKIILSSRIRSVLSGIK